MLSPAAPAAAAMPNGRQQAMQEIALTTAATGANFSLCFKLFGALEGAYEAAAAEALAPGLVEAVALIGVLQRVGGHGVFQFGQRRIEDIFVAAVAVGFRHAASGDFDQRSGG